MKFLFLGADLIVCDEGHIIKNEKSILSKALSKIATKRRIVLTGTPLQNNLNECKSCLMRFLYMNGLSRYFGEDGRKN